MEGVPAQEVADGEVLEYLRLGVLASRADLACMSPAAEAKFRRMHEDGYEGAVVRELGLLPSVEELRAKHSRDVLFAIAERSRDSREKQAQRIIAGLGDHARKEHQDRLLAEACLQMSRVLSAVTNGPKSKGELVRALSKMLGRDEREIRRFLNKPPEPPFSVRISFETSQGSARNPGV